jgi:hypothetical protein
VLTYERGRSVVTKKLPTNLWFKFEHRIGVHAVRAKAVLIDVSTSKGKRKNAQKYKTTMHSCCFVDKVRKLKNLNGCLDFKFDR